MELSLPAELATPQAQIPVPPGPALRMPALAGGTHAHLHSVDSALVSLAALGIPQSRIQLRRAGRDGLPPGTIVHQQPPAGAPLDAHTLVELDISGLGFNHALPVGMWDSGGEAAAGTREILEPFDDPLEKLKHWYHEGAPLFRIAPDDPQACVRWLALFGVDASVWPQPLWFRLASLMARMAQLSCSQQGWAFVLNVLLGLPVQSFQYKPAESKLPPAALSGLGARSSQLGLDMLLGDRVEEMARLTLELGSVTLATYEHFTETAEGSALLARTLALVMPCSVQYDLAWSVLDRGQAPRLGMADHNARLGINTHMGGTLNAKAPAEPALPRPLELASPETDAPPLSDLERIDQELRKAERAAGKIDTIPTDPRSDA